MKQNYKFVVQYEGTRYDGWQRQGNTAQTIQGKLESILQKMTGEEVEIHGSGRTDAGVHAKGQVGNFVLKGEAVREPDEIKTYMNRYLPEDISILSMERVPERFHSRLLAAKKTYVYEIETGEKMDVFVRRLQYGLLQPLDVPQMKIAANHLRGTHDFKSFCGNKKMKKSTIRTIEEIRIEEKGSLITLSFTGDGFLQNMVRIMVGTLIEVGLGKRKAASVADTLKALDRQTAGVTAPAEGLCLLEVFYES